MIYRHAFILSTAHRKIQKLMADGCIHETGGPMVGYVTDDNAIVIKDVAGPGSHGIRRFLSVWIDGDHSQRFSDQAFHQSGGTVDYVGDWHCHPGFSVRPSGRDHAAIKEMAEIKGILSHPISMILSRMSGRFQVYEWSEDSGLNPIPSSIYSPAQ